MYFCRHFTLKYLDYVRSYKLYLLKFYVISFLFLTQTFSYLSINYNSFIQTFVFQKAISVLYLKLKKSWMFDGSRIVRNHRNFIFSVIQNFKFITLKYFGTVLLRILLCFVILLILVLIIHILSHSWKCINNNLIKMASSRCSSNLNNLNSFAYVYSKELENESNKLPTLLNRVIT